MGTLVGLDDPVAALQEQLAGLGVAVSATEASAGLAAEIAHYRRHMLTGSDRPRLSTLRAQCAGVLRDALPAGAHGLDIETMTAVLLDALRFTAFTDARPALIAARLRGARIVVVSNWDASLPEVLERTGLAPLLDAVVTSAAVGFAKPAPEIFTHALGVAGIAAQDAVHVGDSLAEDVAGARACGITPVLVRRDGGSPAPPADVATVSRLTELDALWPTFPSDP